MQKDKSNIFHEKFRLLNSQKHADDIKWSLSSSSEYENTSCNEKLTNLDRKSRKRKRKKKVIKNISNLDITIIDSCNDHKSAIVTEKSPILVSKRVAAFDSPILTSSRLPPKDIDTNSPILCNKSFSPKSPILNFKTTTLNPVRVRKKLSYEKSNSPEKDKRKTDQDEMIKGHVKKQNKDALESMCIKSESNYFTDSDSSLKIKLMKKVKNFFDCHFSSDNTSQNISDTPTPTDCSKNEEIDILSCKTQTDSHMSVKLESVSNSDTSYFDKNTKKVKHKKGGLAYRMNALLKKRNAHIALWQHERYLAGNSNFIIPKEENIVFRIQKVVFNYGCYLLNAVDFNSEKYLIIIHFKYVNTNINVDSVLKLYEPYKILELNQDHKIIINICKFECVDIKE